MALFSTAQIESAFEQTGGDRVIFGAVDTFGHLDIEDADLQRWGVQSDVTGRIRQLRGAWAKLGTLEKGDVGTIGGAAFTLVSDPLRDRDEAVLFVKES